MNLRAASAVVLSLIGCVSFARAISAEPSPAKDALAAVVTNGSSEPFPAVLNFKPGKEYADKDREFQGIPSVARAPGGRIWATWYGGGKGEGPENYIMLATSGDDGDTWSDLKLVIDPPFRASEPGIWVDPQGRLWLMVNLYPKGLREGDTQMWVMTTANPDDENPTWTQPRLIARNLNNFNKPIVLRSGRWLWPTGNWWKERDLAHPSHPLLSDDQGRTFKMGGPLLVPPEVREFDEYNVVERRDGRLWLLTRTKDGPYEAFSEDDGRTWSPAKPHPFIKHDVSRHFLTKLHSGRLLLVKHGRIDEPTRTGRTCLMAFLSDDDGQTWKGGLMLDERQVSYPDGCQAPDGTIYVIYDHERHRAAQILMARFTEQDVLAGRLVSERSALRRVVNDAGGRKSEPVPKKEDLLQGFVHPPIIFNPGKEYGSDKRNYQGIPTIERAPKGRLWASWYAGKVWEDKYNYVVAATSGDDGKTWSDLKFVIDPDGDGPKRASDPCLWLDPTGKLWLFWWMDGDALSATMAVTCANPDAENPKWSKPKALFPGVMLNKPTVLKNGDWLMPAAMWKRDNSARVMISKDRGKSFTLLGAANIPPARRNADEHMTVERKDGSLVMLVRTAEHGIGRSISKDGGRTWTEVADYIPNATSRFYFRKLLSGNLLLLKHGPLDQRIGRSELTAYLSEDDGETWKGGLMIDERNSVSYPDGTQAPDGTIYLIYDWERGRDKNILMATFTEADILARTFSKDSRQRVLINFATGINPRIAAGKKKAVATPNNNEDGEPLRNSTPGKLRAEGFKPEPLSVGALLFADRKYALAELPDALRGAQFLRIPMDGTKTLTCDRAGTVWFLTPATERNKDSQTKTLLNQGFKKVALTEIRLFNHTSTGNFCTLYQKDCAAGDTITIGKWAVPLFPQ